MLPTCSLLVARIAIFLLAINKKFTALLKQLYFPDTLLLDRMVRTREKWSVSRKKMYLN